MDSDLLIPVFWTFVFSLLLFVGVKRLSKRDKKEKKWVRPSNNKSSENNSELK